YTILLSFLPCTCRSTLMGRGTMGRWDVCWRNKFSTQFPPFIQTIDNQRILQNQVLPRNEILGQGRWRKKFVGCKKGVLKWSEMAFNVLRDGL
ncbi:MAG: hypothetical protein IKP16_05990, partial [Prevotella sp.]|nr:hypothetical protein [Prevotella sp.]